MAGAAPGASPAPARAARRRRARPADAYSGRGRNLAGAAHALGPWRGAPAGEQRRTWVLRGEGAGVTGGGCSDHLSLEESRVTHEIERSAAGLDITAAGCSYQVVSGLAPLPGRGQPLRG